ncbi:hypothetical protein PVAP13_3KG125673 [Panicum virgatum]|uniref:Uncharacterized protein n=1 Tax=Panicum virgatum TaxID=38727 RepID=A0A8T0UZ41_PANVG|nr:hypothetical protein PVAP13_3KG125673 [Panicum virgatum]
MRGSSWREQKKRGAGTPAGSFSRLSWPTARSPRQLIPPPPPSSPAPRARVPARRRRGSARSSPPSLLPRRPSLLERIKRSGKSARDGPLLFGTQLMKHEGKDDELVVEAAPQGAKHSSHQSPRKSSCRRPFRWTRPSSTAPCALLVDASHLLAAASSSRAAIAGPAATAAPPPPPTRTVLASTSSSPTSACRATSSSTTAGPMSPTSAAPTTAAAPFSARRGGADASRPPRRRPLVGPPRRRLRHTASGRRALARGSASLGPDTGPPATARDDASLFLMAAGPLGGGAPVSVVLVQAMASPPALPRYTCTFYTNLPRARRRLAGTQARGAGDEGGGRG